MKGLALLVAGLCLGVVSLNSHAVSCDNVPEWNNGAVYTNGMQAQHAQKLYKANWWTQNHSPANYSGPWQEWTYLGDCDVAVNRPPVAVLSITRSSSSSSGDFWVTGYLNLNGSSSYDPDNDPLTFSWDGVNFSSTSVKTVPISRVFDNCFDIYQTYTLTVKDTAGATSTASQTVLVAPASSGNPNCRSSSSSRSSVANNNPPVAVLSISNVSSSGSYPVQYTYTFSGAGSYDPDSDPLTYSWDDGASFSTTPVKTIAFGVFYDLCETRYSRVTLTVKDSKGEVSTASQLVKVGDPAPGNPRCNSSSSVGSSSSVSSNNPPVARISTTTVQLVAGKVPLGASGHMSTDADGDVLAYSWNFGDGQSATGVGVNHLYANAGSYTLSLTVSDGKGGTHTATSLVMVSHASSSSSSRIADDSCLFPPYVPGTTYVKDQLATNGGNLYRCDVAGWCSSSAAWAYAPGTGAHWAMAWTLVRSCSGDSNSSLINDASSRSSSSAPVSSSSVSSSSANNGLPKHALVGYWHNFNNGSGIIRLADVDDVWDVIVIAFADDVGNGTVAFNLDPALNKAQFIADVATKRAQGKKVVLSFGGERGTVTLNNATNLANFVNSTAAIINEYGFDGIDIDLESGANVSWGAPVIGNIVAAVKQLKQQFPDMYLSMAPEHPYVHGGMIAATGIWGAYLPMIDGLRDDLDLLHVQLYNNGGLATPYSPQPLQAGTVDFMVASVKMLVEGFPIANNTQFAGLRPDQVAIGVPSGSRSAGSGFVTIADLNNAVNCLAKLVGCGNIKPNQAYPDFRGVMTWSINWDVADGRPFSIPVNANLDALP